MISCTQLHCGAIYVCLASSASCFVLKYNILAYGKIIWCCLWDWCLSSSASWIVSICCMTISQCCHICLVSVVCLLYGDMMCFCMWPANILSSLCHIHMSVSNKIKLLDEGQQDILLYLICCHWYAIYIWILVSAGFIWNCLIYGNMTCFSMWRANILSFLCHICLAT